MSDFPFLGASFDGRSPSFDAQRSINLYFEMSESGTSRSKGVLLGTPGLDLWTTLASAGGIRGMLRFDDDIAIAVCGGNIWQLAASGAATLLGTMANRLTPVSMASNGRVVMLVDGTGAGYFVDPVAGTVTPAESDTYLGGVRVDFCDGYFIWNNPQSGQFQISGLYATTIDGLDFATAEGSPDNLVTLIVDHRELWLLGENSSEVWYDVGNVDFPFQRVQGAFLEIGCAAAFSVAKMDNSIFWLATDDRGSKTVQRAVGYSPARISNHAVEFAIAGYERIDDAIAYTYSQEGHSFYVLSFPTADATWVYDAATQLWHERAYRYPDTGLLGRHRSNCQMSFAGLNLVGDWQNGNIYALDLDTFSDNGDILPAIRRAPHVTDDGKRVIFTELQLFMQTGVGLQTAQGSDPQAILRWSDDGGYNWSSEMPASIGMVGATRSRVRWQRLGMSRDRVFEVTITDPVRRVITACNLVTVGCKT